MTTKERTLRFITYKGLSVKKFEEMCGLSNGYLNSMKSGYGSSKLAQVLTAFPDLNRDWLVYGEGEMIKGETNIPEKKEMKLSPRALAAMGDPVAEDALIAELRAQVEKLEAKIDYLNQVLGEQNAIIKMMRKGDVESV